MFLFVKYCETLIALPRQHRKHWCIRHTSDQLQTYDCFLLLSWLDDQFRIQCLREWLRNFITCGLIMNLIALTPQNRITVLFLARKIWLTSPATSDFLHSSPHGAPFSHFAPHRQITPQPDLEDGQTNKKKGETTKGKMPQRYLHCASAGYVTTWELGPDKRNTEMGLQIAIGTF